MSRSSLKVLPVGTWVQSVQPLREVPESFDNAVDGALKWPAEVSSPPDASHGGIERRDQIATLTWQQPVAGNNQPLDYQRQKVAMN